MSDAYIGEIRMFGGNFAPRNWALCNGQLLPINQNAALFSILGTTYGGNGVSDFGLPNLQGRVPVHAGSLQGGSIYTLGQNSGSETVNLSPTEMPQHTHTASFSSASVTLLGSPNGSDTAAPGGNYLGNALDGGGGTGSTYVTAANAGQTAAIAGLSLNLNSLQIGLAGGSTAHENRQPYMVVNFIIALVGMFPTRN